MHFGLQALHLSHKQPQNSFVRQNKLVVALRDRLWPGSVLRKILDQHPKDKTTWEDLSCNVPANGPTLKDEKAVIVHGRHLAKMLQLLAGFALLVILGTFNEDVFIR